MLCINKRLYWPCRPYWSDRGAGSHRPYRLHWPYWSQRTDWFAWPNRPHWGYWSYRTDWTARTCGGSGGDRANRGIR